MNLTEFIAQLAAGFNSSVGLNLESLWRELEILARRMGIGPGDPLTDAYFKRAKEIYTAYLSQVGNNIAEFGWQEVKQLLQSGTVPARKRRVGASTA